MKLNRLPLFGVKKKKMKTLYNINKLSNIIWYSCDPGYQEVSVKRTINGLVIHFENEDELSYLIVRTHEL